MKADDDDDDDLPPPLDAARSLAPTASESTTRRRGVPLSQEELQSHDYERNEAAQSLMDKALELREKKRQEAERQRKAADLKSGGGLSKGFLLSSSSKGKKKPQPKPTSEKEKEEIPFIAGAPTLEAAKEASLQLPEVQQAIKGATKNLQEDKSWMTPQLLQAMASRPDLMKGMEHPRVQAALALMQTDPQAAGERYKDDAEVSGFLKEFSSMMATHFDILGAEGAKKQRAESGGQPAVETSKPAEPGARRVLKPEESAALADPEVKAVLAAARAGKPMEMHEIGQTNPRLLHNLKILLDGGLLNLQT